MFWNLAKAQQRKLLRQPLTWIEGGTLTLLVIIFSALPHAVRGADPERDIALSLDLGNELLMATRTAGSSSLGGLLLIIIVGASLAREYRWRSVHLWLSRGVSRRSFLCSKLLSFVGVMLLIPLLAAVAAIPGTAYFIHAQHGAVGLSAAGLLQALASIPVATYALLPYVALASLLAVWRRSPAAAIGGGLAFALVVEGLLVQLLASLGGVGLLAARYLPTSLGHSLMSGEGGLVPAVGPVAAAVVIFAYAGSLLFITNALFERQDLAD